MFLKLKIVIVFSMKHIDFLVRTLALSLVDICSRKSISIRPKIKILLFPEIRMTRKSSPRRLQIFFVNLFNLIFQIKFTLKELLKQHFFFVEKQKVLPFIVRREKNVSLSE